MVIALISDESNIDGAILKELEKSGTNFTCSLPCNMLAGFLKELDLSVKIRNIPITREEEGVGICAGAYLGGLKPALIMQNSAIGTTINALLSLTGLYGLGLLLLVSYRGTSHEKSIAHVPMGNVSEKILNAAGIKYSVIKTRVELKEIRHYAKESQQGKINVLLLHPNLWRLK